MSTRFLSPVHLARASAHRPWRVLSVWVLLVALAVVAQATLPNPLTSEGTFANKPESVRGADLLETRLRGPEPLTETVVVRSAETTVDDPAFRTVVERTTAELRALDPIVASVANYYEAATAGAPSAAGMVSPDRHATILPVTLTGNLDDLIPHAAAYADAVAAQNDGAYEVLTVGGLSADAEFSRIADEDLARGEGIGAGVALVVLVVLFGALVAAGIPILLAVASIVVAMGLTTLIGQRFELHEIVTTIVSMIGLAVGIDYALVIVERYREERRRGAAKHLAIELASGTATRAVLFSGGTVIVALLGMLIVPMSVFRSLAIGASLVVVAAMLASLTLVPALLGLLGDKIDWPRRRRPAATAPLSPPLPDSNPIPTGFWGRLTQLVMARPVVSALLAVALLLAAALPVLDLKTGDSGVEALPAGNVKTAFALLERDFYAGIVSPVEIVIDGPAADPAVQSGIDRLTAALAADDLYGPPTLTTNAANDLTLLSVPMATAANSPTATAAIAALRDEHVPAAFADAPAEVLIAGIAALNTDTTALMADSVPLVFAFVLGLSFLLLAIAFRSLIVPLKAISMNLLSVGAAYGLLVLVFQKGVGADLFGFQRTPTIESWLPIFLFCVLFGLSMDYHVFLLSRIREHYDATGRNAESVAVGLQATAKIITGAALIMVAVFGGFAAGRLVPLQQLGFGLAVAILLDATIVRSILVPATMTLLGDRNWYFPRWLRWLPNLRLDAAPTPPPVPVPAPSPAPAAAAD